MSDDTNQIDPPGDETTAIAGVAGVAGPEIKNPFAGGPPMSGRELTTHVRTLGKTIGDVVETGHSVLEAVGSLEARVADLEERDPPRGAREADLLRSAGFASAEARRLGDELAATRLELAEARRELRAEREAAGELRDRVTKLEFVEVERDAAMVKIEELESALSASDDALVERNAEVLELRERVAGLESVPEYGETAREIVAGVLREVEDLGGGTTLPSPEQLPGSVERVDAAFRTQARVLLGVRKYAVIRWEIGSGRPDVRLYDDLDRARTALDLPGSAGENRYIAAVLPPGPPNPLP